MNPFDKILKSNNQPATSTKKVGLYDDILADIKPSEPKVSTGSKIKAGAKNITAGLLKLPARAATNIYQGATGSNATPFSGKFLGDVNPIGTQTFDKGGIDIKNPKAGLKNTAKDLIDIGGASVEAASYLPFGRAIKGGYTAGKAFVTGGKETAKQTLKGMAAEGAIGGFTGSLGQQAQDKAQTGRNISLKEAGIGAVGGAIAAPALGLLGRGIGKIFSRGEAPVASAVADEIVPQMNTTNRISSMVDNSLEKRTDGIREKSLQFYRENPEEITKSPVRVREVDGRLTIEDGRHRLEAARELGIPDIKVEDVTPQYPQVEGTLGKESDILSSIINNGKKAPELAQQAVQEAETFTPSLATRVEADAVEKGLVTKFEGLPEAQTMNMRKQADDAVNLVNTDYEFAKRVALGTENAPGDLRDASVFEAVKVKALKDGDIQTLKQLATESTVPARISAAAQQVKAADARLLDSTDPVELMQTVIKAREKGVQLKQKAARVADTAQVKQIIKKAPKRQDWDAFITSIEC